MEQQGKFKETIKIMLDMLREYRSAHFSYIGSVVALDLFIEVGMIEVQNNMMVIEIVGNEDGLLKIHLNKLTGIKTKRDEKVYEFISGDGEKIIIEFF